MKMLLSILFLGIFSSPISPLLEIGPGEQPQMSVDAKGIIRLVYGQGDRIFYCFSEDKGSSFSKPEVIAQVDDMHLGMTRGPQLASSKDYSIITAIDKKGNIHSFQLDHRAKNWIKRENVNDVEGSAPEGLMSITADEANTFYAVWLDLREDKNNKIAFSTLTTSAPWSTNKIVYKSPDKTVCECCKPSIAVKGKMVSLMFRNWISGSRDMYLTSSSDGGFKFGNPAKLGNGNWKLQGCPMDGGGISIDKNNLVHTVWQREGNVYYSQPGRSEIKIADGRSCNLFGSETPFVAWQVGTQIYGQPLNGNRITIGDGVAANIVQLNDQGLLAAWENDGKILIRKL